MSSAKKLTIDNIAHLLKHRGLISAEQLSEILAQGKSHESRLYASHHPGSARRAQSGADLVSPAEVIASFNLEICGSPGRYLTEDAITEEVALKLGMPYLKIDPLKLDLNVVTSHIPRPFALKHLIVAVAESRGVITVAVADPFNQRLVEELAEARELKIQRVLSSKSDILKILREFYGFRASVVAAEAEATSGVDLGNLEQFFKLRGQQEIEGTDKHVISAVEFLLQYAFDQHASDIHIEPKREKSLIRFRLDGVMHNIHVIPKPLHAPIVSRIKMLSRMDLAEKRRPQDGRIKTRFGNKDIELRVSTVPVAFGEKVVIRIFDPDILLQDLDSMGFYPREMTLFNSFIRRPNGIILVTGPTGSGKTTTLYAALNALNRPDRKIITAEEPVEYYLPGINQVEVRHNIGLDFARIIRSMLRQAPNIILVGEMRDNETASMGIQASLTGHLVFSTLHTNDAPSAVTRMVDIGVPNYLVASSVIAVLAQRLVRIICPKCKQQIQLPESVIRDAGIPAKLAAKAHFSKGKGCSNCNKGGFRGRQGIFELMLVNSKIREMIFQNISSVEIRKQAITQGMKTLYVDGIRKVVNGVTTLEEVYRNAKRTEQDVITA